MPTAQLTQCPACAGRRVLPNARTGQPCACPICNGTGLVEPLYDRLPFWYVINETILAALGTNNGSLRCEARADFEWVWLTHSASTGVFSTQMTDAGGRVFQSAAVNSENQWGTAQRPFPLIAPCILKARTGLNYVLTDRSAAPGNVIQLALSGYELYALS